MSLLKPPRRRGRPSLTLNGTPAASVNVKMEPAMYDLVYTVAVKQDISIPEAIRRAMRRVFHPDNAHHSAT